MASERLQKILARAGVASRRAAESVIVAGRVRVNGQIVNELGAKADLVRDRVEVDGRKLVAEPRVVVLLHKPKGTVTTANDPEGRPTVTEYVRTIPLRLYPVGRLDFQTSGALLLTNDGEMSATLLHPRRHVPKTYLVKVQGEMQKDDVERWRQGVALDDGPTQPATVAVMDQKEGATWMHVTLTEGRNQQIRRMGEATGFPVMRLTRLQFAGIGIEGMHAGQWRFLTPDELRTLSTTFGAPKHVRTIISDQEQYRHLEPVRRVRKSHNDRPMTSIGEPASDDGDNRPTRKARGAPKREDGSARRGDSRPATGDRRDRPATGDRHDAPRPRRAGDSAARPPSKRRP